MQQCIVRQGFEYVMIYVTTLNTFPFSCQTAEPLQIRDRKEATCERKVFIMGSKNAILGRAISSFQHIGPDYQNNKCSTDLGPHIALLRLVPHSTVLL